MKDESLKINAKELLEECKVAWALRDETGKIAQLIKCNELTAKTYRGFILEFDDNTKRYAYLSDENNELHLKVSEPFGKLIIEFTDSILVEDLTGHRKFIHHHTTNLCGWNTGRYNNEVKHLTDGRAVIVNSKLSVSEPFEKHIQIMNFDSDIYNSFRIVKCGENDYAIIRIRDLSSFHCVHADYIANTSDYALVTLEDGKKAIVQIYDITFKISSHFKYISFSQYGYAFVSDDGQNYEVMRVSDFKVIS